MKSAVDSSVIIAAINADDPDHESCAALFASGSRGAYSHALTETFSTLTGGRLRFRVPARQAAGIIRDQLKPRLNLVPLDEGDLIVAFEEAESRGIRGGAIYDYLHLFAARKAGVKVLYTLNQSDFLAFHRPGDPTIRIP
jgi:predicted nucleic acid-binding protein